MNEIVVLNITYRLLNRDEIFEKKLVRPEYGESAVVPPVPGISIPVLFLDRVWPIGEIRWFI